MKVDIIKFVAISLCLCTPPVSHAAPNISGVSGTLSNGQSITLSGSSFGSGPNVVFFDDFEKGTNGAALLTGAGSAQVGTWATIDVPSITYSTAAKVSGSLALRSSPYAPWYMGGRGRIAISPATQIFFSSWVRTDAWPQNETSINWKVIWPQGTGTTDHDLAAPVYRWDGGGDYAGNDTAGWVDFGSAPPLSLNTWSRQWHWISDGSGSDDQIQGWYMDGSGVHSNINRSSQTMWTSGTFQNFLIPGNVEIYDVNPHPMYDDVYIATGANARARVEIGNAATYNNSTNLAILTPAVWSNSSITATVRQGSFSNGQQAYLYVVDSAGAVNANGYPVIIGSGTQPDLIPPASPSGLMVQ